MHGRMRSAVVVAGVFFMLAGGVFTSTAHAQATWNGANGATWDTTAANWLNASGTPWDSTNGLTGTATFTATSGSAVVNGSVFANRLDYTAASGTFAIRGGTLNLAGTTPTISVNPSRTLTIGSTLAGSAGLTKTGSGTLVLSSSNSYSGTSTSNGGGTLQASNPNSFGTSTVINDGTSTVTLGSGTYANQFRLFGGGVSSGGAIQTTAASSVVVNGLFTGTSAGNLLNVTPASTSTLRFSGGFNAAGSNVYFATGTSILDSANWNISGLQANGNGTIVIAQSGSATFLVRFNGSNSTIRTDVANAWGAGLSYLQWNSGTSGKLDLNGNNQSAPYLNVNASLFAAGGTGRVITSAAPATFTTPQSTSGTFDGIFTGSAALTKAGSGGNTTILSLTGPSTSTGAVTITNGTIALGTSGTGSAVQLGSLAASSIIIGSTNSTNAALDISPRGASYTFTAGQTISGTGTLVTGASLTATSNGTWAPGNSGIGRLAVTGNLTLGGTSQFDLASPGASTAAPGSSDLTAVSGTLALGGALNLSNAGGLAGGVYRLFTYGSASGSYTSVTTTPTTRSGPSLVTLGGSGTGSGQGVFLTVYNQAAASLVSSTSVNLGLIHAGASFGTQALTISNTAAGGSFTEGLDAAASGTTGDASSLGAVANLAAGGTSTLVTVGLGGANTTTGGVKSGAVTVGFASSGVASGLGAAAIGSQVVNVSGSVFDGNATWIQSTGGSWGTLSNANWTSTGGIAAAPGTFVGYTNVDTATFAGAIASGTATVALNGAQASLAGLAFSNTTARYVIATGTGSGSLTLATATGKPTVNVIGAHEIAAAIAGSSGLQKLGAGTLVLSGSNSFSGATDITAGLLAVNGSIAGAANVAANAILGGSGSVGGLVSVAAGGILSPGNSPGTLALSGGLTLDPASILQFELNATDTTIGSGINDLVDVTGNLTLGGTLDITGIGDFTTALNTSVWRLFNYSGGSFSGSLSLGTAPDLGGGRTFAIDTATPGEVNLVVVPEPSALLLAGLGIAAAVRLARRRSTP